MMRHAVEGADLLATYLSQTDTGVYRLQSTCLSHWYRCVFLDFLAAFV